MKRRGLLFWLLVALVAAALAMRSGRELPADVAARLAGGV